MYCEFCSLFYLSLAAWSELQIPKWKKEETFRLPFTQQGVAGRGGDEKKKIDGEKIHTRGEKMPQGASTDFYL